MAIDDVQVANGWLLGLLSGNPTLVAALAAPPTPYTSQGSIYATMAPDDALFPYVIYALLSSQDMKTQQGITTEINHIYTIQGFSNNPDESPVLQVRALINNSIDGQAATVSGFKMNCIRQQGLAQAYIYQGNRYYQAGARYLVKMRPQVLTP